MPLTSRPFQFLGKGLPVVKADEWNIHLFELNRYLLFPIQQLQSTFQPLSGTSLERTTYDTSLLPTFAIWLETDTHAYWLWDGTLGVWVGKISIGGIAGGDLSGTYPNPTVSKINGVAYNADPLSQYLYLPGRGGQTINDNVIISGISPTLQIYASTNNRTLKFDPASGALDSINASFHFNRFSANPVAIGFSSDSHFRVGQGSGEVIFGSTALAYVAGTLDEITFGVWGTGNTSKDIFQVGNTFPSVSGKFLCVNHSGLVGINNASPSYPLDVNGNANISGTLTAGNITATPTASKVPIADGSGKLDGWISTATATTAGLVPTPPNDSTKVLLGDATWGSALLPSGLTFLSNTSSVKTPTASAQWQQMTNNSITLTPGTWKIYGTVIFGTNGSGASYNAIDYAWCTANGADSGVQPTLITPKVGFVGGRNTGGITHDGFNTNGITGFQTMVLNTEPMVIAVASSTTIYLNNYQATNTYTNSRIYCSLWAELISTATS